MYFATRNHVESFSLGWHSLHSVVGLWHRVYGFSPPNSYKGVISVTTFNPLEQQGIPLDQQLRNWRELNVPQLDPDHSDPYARCRVITMNGIEMEAVGFSHQFARRCP